jgi:hypothetical protein
MAAYSGDWSLLRAESDDLEGRLRASQRNQSAGGFGDGMTGARGGGSRGGVGGGGGRRAGGAKRGGTPGGGVDLQAMQRAFEAVQVLARVPEEITLGLRPETVSVLQNQDESTALRLTLGADESEFIHGGMSVSARAKWTKRGIEIERVIDGGKVKDELSIDEEGRLSFKREVEVMGRHVDGTLVYSRAGGEG